MIEMEQKYSALLREAQRRSRPGVENMHLCFEVLSLAAAIDRSCAMHLAPHRLSESKFVLLFLLHGERDGLSPYELAERAGVTRATITGLLDGLERDGFVVRRSDVVDRRKILICLTAEGDALAATLFDEHTDWIASLFDGFDAPSREAVSNLLQRVWRNIGTSSRETGGATPGDQP